MAHHGWRKGSLPGSSIGTLLSDGIKFDSVQGDHRKEVKADKTARSPTKLLKPKRKVPSAAQECSVGTRFVMQKLCSILMQPTKKPATSHLSALMPAFGQGSKVNERSSVIELMYDSTESRDRSESCGASFTPNQPGATQPLHSVVPVTAINPMHRNKPIPQRPQMIRKASSAGELGSLLPYDTPSIPHSSSQERPQPGPAPKDLPAPPQHANEPDSHITPGRKPRYDSLQASPSPMRPATRGPLLPRVRQMSNGDIQPTARPFDASVRQSVRRKPLPQPFSEARQAPVQISMHSQGKSQQAELEVDADGATIVLNCVDPVEFEWKCVSAPGELGSRWELRIRRPEFGSSHTPMPFSPASFTNTPSLSPASLRTTSPSPTPSTPAFRSTSAQSRTSHSGFRQGSSPVLFADPFLTKDTTGTPKNPQWPPSPCTQDFSSGSDSPPLPSTPKRNGFVLPPGYTSPMNKAQSPRTKSHASFRSSLSPYREQSAMSFMTSPTDTYAISPPTTPQSRRHVSGVSKSSTTRPLTIRRSSSDASDEEEEDWDGYADILEQANRLSGDSLKPSGLMLLSPPDETSALARRRVGNKAFELRLAFDQSPPPKHDIEISRWSETEGGESEDDSSFSESRPSSFSR